MAGCLQRKKESINDLGRILNTLEGRGAAGTVYEADRSGMF